MPFNYNAHTSAIGGLIGENNAQRPLPSRASVTLSPDGGFGESCVSNYSEEGISFYRGESRVYGSSFYDELAGKTRLFKTFANVGVYGLNIDGIVQADVVSASITSINERVGNCASESLISINASLVGLIIDRHPYDVELDPTPFHEHGTFSAFTTSLANMKEQEIAVAAKRYAWEKRDWWINGRVQVPQHCQNGLRASIVSDIRPALRSSPPLKRSGYIIEVPNLGLLHLGEVVLLVGKRSINMMRVELGKTLADLAPKPTLVSSPARPPVPLPSGPDGAVPRFMTAAAKGPGKGGGYTVVYAMGNGTDLGPPPV